MYGGQMTSAHTMNTGWGSTTAAGRRRTTQGNNNAMTALTMSGLGMVGGMMAGKAITSGNDRPNRHTKMVAQNPPPSQVEHNYTQYKHGSNVNAQLKPVTYDTFKGSSVMAQAGSNKSSSMASSHPQQQRPHRPHAHGKSGSQSHGAALSTQAVAGSGASSSTSSGVNTGGPSGESKSARQQWAYHNQSASGSMNSSYHAFDNSAGAHPLTSSVLAFNSASNNQSHPQIRPSPQHQGGQPVAGQGAPNTYAASGAMHSLPSVAWAHGTTGLNPSHSIAATTTATRFDPSALESDMAAAGFMHMHSKYKATKQGKSGHNTSLPQTQQPTGNVVYSQAPQTAPANYQPRPQPQPQPQPHQYTSQNGVPGPVYQQPQQQTAAYQSQSMVPMHQNQQQQQYGPQPIPVPTQAPAIQHGYTSYTYPVTQSYSALPTGLTYTQAPPAEFGGQSHTQHQRYPLDTFSHSVPATYDAFNQPQGLASSYQNATYSSPQILHVSSDTIPLLRPKKRVHFADHF
ncbi:hypothetical protein H4R27_004784 [Coemansia aciculifera]|nr:hypothetical protein H4R27_004784 [Coemansia aciculifera]